MFSEAVSYVCTVGVSRADITFWHQFDCRGTPLAISLESPDADETDESPPCACRFGLSSGENTVFEKGLYADFLAYRVSSAGSQVWRWQV